jgi:hypothetical protein
MAMLGALVIMALLILITTFGQLEIWISCLKGWKG